MANFKTVMRMAKLPWCKREFSVPGYRVVNADNHVLVWAPAEHDVARDVEGDQQDEPSPMDRDRTALALDALSVPLADMVQVNGDYLRRAISALESKGKAPIYIDIKSKRICLAYEVEGEVHRAAVACMENKHAAHLT